ncbi:hypothetical protein [Simiduia aestuariiviva]|uniref:Uncharacterized protein n=1 Tax=Simiduia aestuariiviva TaxID=1510459 RepID=A0A839UU29_9GAMM|nr:hypothetical protein [Simiduia aestuariiviva]MBB3169950.1 hypothetical protein [Simiduia aestuariiviva]
MARLKRECHIGVGYHRTGKLREKLIREITGFERQLQALQMQSGPVDFSLLQTYKELIACRQTVLKGLPQDTYT